MTYIYTIASIEDNGGIDYQGEYNNIEEAISKIKYLESLHTDAIYIIIGKST